MPTQLVENNSLSVSTLHEGTDPNALVVKIVEQIESCLASPARAVPTRDELVAEFGNASAVSDALAVLRERSVEQSVPTSQAVIEDTSTEKIPGSASELDRTIEAERFHRIMADPALREEYYRKEVVPVVEFMVGVVRARYASQRFSDDDIRADLLVASQDLLAEADPMIRDPLKHLRSMLPYRVIDIWRKESQLPRSCTTKIKLLDSTRDDILKRQGPTQRVDDEQIALRTGLTQDQIALAEMNRRFASPVSLDSPPPSFGEGKGTFADSLPDLRPALSGAQAQDDLFRSLTKSLSIKARTILRLYFQEGLTLREIGNLFEVTESRACQIFNEAIKQLRKNLTATELSSHGVYGMYSSRRGFTALLETIRSDGLAEASSGGLSHFVDGPKFFERYFSREGNQILKFRRKVLENDGKLQFEQMSPQARQAFIEHVRAKHPEGYYLHRSRGISKALGLEGREASAALIRRELVKLGVYQTQVPGSIGFEHFLVDYKSPQSVGANAEALAVYVDSPDFFNAFFSEESKAILPFKVALYRAEEGIGFYKFSPEVQEHFRNFIRSLWLTAADVKRDVRICLALGLGENERSIPMMLDRMYAMGIYAPPVSRSPGYDRLLIDLRTKPKLNPSTGTLLHYIDGPGFFHEFTSPQSRALKYFKSAWLKLEGGITFSQLTPEAFEHFRQFVRERCPDPNKIRRDGDAGMITLLGLKSETRSLAVVTERLIELGVYPARQVVSIGFNDLINDYHRHNNVPANWTALVPYIDAPVFFKLYFSYESLPIRELKNSIIQNDGPITEEKVGPLVWAMFKSSVLKKYPTLRDVPRDKALGLALGLGKSIPNRQILADKLVELGLYSPPQLEAAKKSLAKLV